MSNENGHGAFEPLVIPPNPEESFYTCRKTNQNALIGQTFWIFGFQSKQVEKDGRVSDKYVLKCRREINDSEENDFKFFTGSPQIKYKLEYVKEHEHFPIRCKLVGDGKNFDIVDIVLQR